jgi:hypothetical protein
MQTLAFLWHELKAAKRQLNQALTEGQESREENLAAQKERPEAIKIANKKQGTDERTQRWKNGKIADASFVIRRLLFWARL